MLEMLTTRQKDLLTCLMKQKDGVTVEELSGELHITRNAVRQHLASLENDDLVTPGSTRASGGRPQQLYVLTDKGRECFPRHYSWFAELLVESIVRENGEEGLRTQLDLMGKKVAEQLLRQQPALEKQQDKAEALARVMHGLGYESVSQQEAGSTIIEVDNCVFHTLAMKNPEVCRFDLALMSRFTDSEVEHEECMARGAHVCRFKLK